MASPAPRWKTAIENAIAKYKEQTVVQIATLDTTRPDGPVPRVRSHIVREFLSSPRAPELPLILSSTDVRTPKVSQLAASPRAEVVWWIEGTQQQFRIIADLYVVPFPGQGQEKEKEKREVHEWFLRAVEGAREGTGLAAFRDSILEKGEGQGVVEMEWERRRMEMFRTMGAHMKASWCRPTPGRPLEEEGGKDEAKKWPERIEEPDPDNKEGLPKEKYEERKRNWEKALGNFALVVIDPVEVDFVDLGVDPDRRSLFTKRKVEGGWVWDEQELVP